jgi:hypothetical protein
VIAFDPKDDRHMAVAIKWWGELSEQDRANTFHPSLHKLGPFLQHFSEAADLLFNLDEQGLTLAAWTEPAWDAALFSLWVRPDMRRTPSIWKEIQQAYQLAFTLYPTLVGHTRQPALHAAHIKLGYDYAGCLKSSFKGGQLWIYELTREAWAARKDTARQFRQARQEQRHGKLSDQQRNGERQQHEHDQLTLRLDSGELREGRGEDGSAASLDVVQPDVRGLTNGRG